MCSSSSDLHHDERGYFLENWRKVDLEKFGVPKSLFLNKLQNNVSVSKKGTIRDWIHVEDHCKAICLIIEKGGVGDTYMIGIDNEQTNSNVLQKILNLMNKSSSYYDYIADRKGHDLRYGIDATKLITELGFEPDYKDFDESLKRTIKWYELNQNWWKKLIEKKEGLN